MKLLKISDLIWFGILSAAVFLSLQNAFISADAAYYIPVARDISDGLIPYKDIRSSYTPIMMYLNSVIFYVISNPDYHIFLVFQYLVIISSLGFLYFICIKLKLDIPRTIFLLLFIFISILSSEGTFINLEVYVFLFVVISFWFLLKENFFWSGVFLSLSVFSKQYAILNFLPFGMLLIYHYGSHKKYMTYFVLGASLPVFLFFFYFSVLENVPLNSLIKQLSGGSYASSGVTAEKSFKWLLIDAKVFILMILPFFFMKRDFFRSGLSKILIVGILVNLIPLTIQNFQHYFILTFPYIALLLAYNKEDITPRFFTVANFSLILISMFLFARIERYKDNGDVQKNISQKYIKEYPVGSEVFLDGHIRFLYILNDYRNPVVSKIGYSFGFVPDSAFRTKYQVLPKKGSNP
jgi:hypothetical protein